MPIYEYACAQCGRKNSLFRSSLAAMEAASRDLQCERCGSGALRRLYSRFATGRARPGEGEELYRFDRMTEGLDENDPAQLAEWTRSLEQAEPEPD